MTRVAVVIVTFNSEHEIGACLEALARVQHLDLVVVDNSSQDGTVNEVRARGVMLIANPDNAGFAAAANQGVRATSAPLLLLLNPDAILQGGLEALIAEFGDSQTGAAGGLLIGPDSLPQTGFTARNLPGPAALIFEVMGLNKLWPGNPVNWHYRCLYKDLAVRSRVEQPAGAFLMFSRLAWQRIGGFDERFWPIWFEDVDFCAGLKQAGFSVWFNPGAVAKHAGAHAIRTLSLENRECYWYGSLLDYAAKHFSSPKYRAVCWSVALSAVIHAVVRYPRGGSKILVVYCAVCRFAIGRLFGSRRRSLENTIV